MPAVKLSASAFETHLRRTFGIFLPKAPEPVTWGTYLEGLYAVDWLVCVGCLDGQNAAWEVLFNARTGRSDCLLVDALRARAVRLYPRNEEKQETAVSEFWSNLIAPESEGTLPVLARYDGQRPLAPWLIRVFQNWHLSKLRQNTGTTALPDDEIALPMDAAAAGERLRPVARNVRFGRPRVARFDRRRRALVARAAVALPVESARGREAVQT